MPKNKTLKSIAKKSTKTTKWTDGRLKSFITSTLRGGFRKYPPKYEVLKEAFWGKKVNSKTGRMCMHYTCNSCKKEYPATQVNVDHVLPVVCPKQGFVGWDEFIARLFCEKENLQVLCSACHTVKTKEEREVRNGSKK